MEFIPSSFGAKLCDLIIESKEEILFFLPSLDTCTHILPLLLFKADEGVKIKILVRSSINKKTPTFQLIQQSSIELKSTGQINIFRRSQNSHSELWIVDKKMALFGQPMLADSSTLFLSSEDAKAISDYFLHCWSKVGFFGAKFNYFIRQKKFSFRAGRGCQQDLLKAISRAESEVYVVTPGITKRLTEALLKARKNGAKVTLVTSSIKKNRFSRLRWLIRTNLLKQAGVNLIQVSHRSLDFIALVDKSSAHFGSYRLDLLGRNHLETSLVIFEPQICRKFTEVTETIKENDNNSDHIAVQI